jgi:tetratricopeptide (TPR) repeat protein
MPATQPVASSAPAGARPISQSSLPAWQQLASLRASGRPASAPSFRAPTPSMAPPPVETLDDAGKMRRAEQWVERRNYEEATRIVDELIRRDAKNADYLALRALILYQQLTGNRLSRALIDAIEGVLRLNDQHPRGLYLKGLVYKRMGKEADAVRYFQRTLDADPKHLDAQRELRLAKMRRER